MQNLFVAYDDMLIGRTEGISASFFLGAEASDANQRVALSCIRYALEQVLGWPKEQSVRKFDSYIVRVMRLEQLIKHIVFPDEIDDGDPEYILHLLYPKDVRINWNKKVIQLYEDAKKTKSQFPRSFFLGPEGFERYCVCFKHLVETSKLFYGLDELYQYFLSNEGKALLRDNRLSSPASQFGIDILDVLYAVTKNLKNSRLYYIRYSLESPANKESIVHH